MAGACGGQRRHWIPGTGVTDDHSHMSAVCQDSDLNPTLEHKVLFTTEPSLQHLNLFKK